MRWLVGWSSTAAGSVRSGRGLDRTVTRAHGPPRRFPAPVGRPRSAVGGRRLAPDEVRDRPAPTTPSTRLAVLGCCGATDEELRVGLFAARGGALRHLTAWPGSYTAVVQVGRRITVAGDLAGARPVFYTPWAGGTAYATAALPLADLIEAQLDIGHLAALLACPDVPGGAARRHAVRRACSRVPPGHALILRDGSREIAGYEPVASLAVAAPQLDPTGAVDGVRDALVEAVRARLAAPRHAPETPATRPGPRPRHGPRRTPRGPRRARPRHRRRPVRRQRLRHPRAARGGPARHARHRPRPRHRRGRAAARRHLQRPVTRAPTAARPNWSARAPSPRTPGCTTSSSPAGEEALPVRRAGHGPLTDEPGPSLVIAERHRRRLAAGSADHFVGHGARQVLDAHPARLADLLHGPAPTPPAAPGRRPGQGRTAPRRTRCSSRSPSTAPRAGWPARPTGTASEAARATALLERRTRDGRRGGGQRAAVDASLAALAWCRPGPAARWLTGEALAEVSVRLQDGARIRARPLQRPGEAPRPRRPRPPRGRPPRLRTGRRGPQPAPARALPRQPGRTRLPRPPRGAAGPARAPAPRSCARSSRARASANSPPGWGATSHAAVAAAVRTGLRTALPTTSSRSSTPRCSPTRAWSRPASSARRCARRPRANRCRWTAWPTWSPRNCGCAACSPAAAPAGPARRPASARSPQGASHRSGAHWEPGAEALRPWCPRVPRTGIRATEPVPTVRMDPCGTESWASPRRTTIRHTPARGRTAPARAAHVARAARRPYRLPRTRSSTTYGPTTHPHDAPAALQALVGRLRRALGKDAVDFRGRRRLPASPPHPDDVDLYVFERLVREGRRALDAGDPATAARALATRSPCGADPRSPTCRPHRRGPPRGPAPRSGTRAHRGRPAPRPRRGRRTGADRARRAHPYDEPLHALLIRALRDAGRGADALAAYETARRTLADGLGADPGPELRRPARRPARPRPRPRPRLPAARRRPGSRSAPAICGPA